MSTASTTPTVEVKKVAAKKFHVVSDGEMVKEFKTKREADSFAKTLTPTDATIEQPETPEVPEQPTDPEVPEQPEQPETPSEPDEAPELAGTPRERALKVLSEKESVKDAEEAIKAWQDILTQAREADGTPPAQIAVLEAYIAAGDEFMSSAEDGGTPRSAAAKRAAQARAKKASDEAAAAEQAQATAATASTEGRVTQTGRAAPRPSTVSKDGEMTCTGKCKETKVVTKFPTIGGDKRGTECRKCRDERLAAQRAAKAA